MNPTLESAIKYCEHGYSIIPVGKDKKPLISWTKHQNYKATLEEIKAWFEQFKNPNIGIVTGEISNLLVVDCDSQEAIEEIEKNLPDNLEIPVSQTPRGGRHYYFQHVEGLPNKAGILEKIDIRTKGGFIIAPPSENGNGKKYEWINGIDLLKALPQAMPNSLLHVFKSNINDSYSSSIGVNNFGKKQLFTKGHRDDDLFHVANCLIRGNCEVDYTTQVLSILGKNCSPSFPENEIKTKIESVLKRVKGRERNLTEEVREWVSVTTGDFNVTACDRELQIVTKTDKTARRQAFSRLCKEGLIERTGNNDGYFRLISPEEPDMEFIEEELYEYPVKLPFGLNDLCSLYAKNIVVIAGSKSSGKTAVLLNIARMNQDRKEVIYLNSEMGEQEWTNRLKGMGITKKSEIKFKGKACSGNFHDKIRPGDKIYIIDFLEIHDNFYQVAGLIRKIHEKLLDGICFIAIQKKGIEKLGRGAEFSMEKARLYLTLDYLEDQQCSMLTIVDAKAPKTQINPRGLYKYIKIYGGSKIESLDREWRRLHAKT